MYGRRKLTRVELIVYASLVGVLLLIFASQVAEYMELAEKAAMESTATNVTAALNLRYASLVMAGTTIDAERWTTANPFELANAFPPGYRGELAAWASMPRERPAWLFDSVRHEVLYLPRLHKHLQVGGAPAGEVRFGLRRGPSGFGFALTPSQAYEWRVSPDR